MAAPVLPTPSINTKGPGIVGPDFSYAEAIPLPQNIGVHTGDTVESVTSAIKGIAYYSDTIGFGGPSTSMDGNMGLKPIGVQFWMKTGFTCSNGADMWTYVDGIPTGASLGKSFAKTLSDAGMPALRGMAPGILEDVESALDPTPIMNSVFGTGYPMCKMVEQSVGDQDGNIFKTDEKGAKIYYIANPETAVKRGGRYYQSRWTLDSYVTQSEWNKVPKTFCPNGSVKKGECAKEGFCSSETPAWKQGTLALIAIAGLATLYYVARRRL